MPYPNIDESLWGKMDSCVEQVVGKQPDLDKPAAIGICYQSVVEGKALDDELRRWAGVMAAAKAGARNNRGDKERLQQMHDMAKTTHDSAVANGAECNCDMPEEGMPEKSVPVSLEADDTLVAFGAEVKALGEGRVGGYLVRFSTADNPDLMGEFFMAVEEIGAQ